MEGLEAEIVFPSFDLITEVGSLNVIWQTIVHIINSCFVMY